MKNLFDTNYATTLTTDIQMRVYTSNLLGQSDALVLHGGGNTSVKTVEKKEELLLVKGSGWDLVSIKEEGFAPVKLSTLLEMSKLPTLSDLDMVNGQKAAMTNKNAPNPSVEAILHAIIPFKYVDHTHADAVVTISNARSGIENIENLYPNFLIVPYVMPGFILAKTIVEMVQDFDWSACEGIILHNHGIFTFDDDAKIAYDKMIAAVTLAEEFLNEQAPLTLDTSLEPLGYTIEPLVQAVEQIKGYPVSSKLYQTPLALHYVEHEDLQTFATRGVLTPEHIIRTKRIPLVLEKGSDINLALQKYVQEYKNYFNLHAKNNICLNPAPNYAVIKNVGVVVFADTEKNASIIGDIIEHTMQAVLKADQLGGYQSISIANSFEMEYWELEQIKLRKGV